MVCAKSKTDAISSKSTRLKCICAFFFLIFFSFRICLAGLRQVLFLLSGVAWAR